MKRISVLGCGLVGGLMVRDLANDSGIEITAIDREEEHLDSLASLPHVTLRKADLSNSAAIQSVISDSDAVIGAVPGRLGFSMLRAVIEAGKPIADISFSPEDPLELDDLARMKGVTAVVDCGVSPGLSNLAIGRASSQLAEIDEALIYVGGLPAERYWPYEYSIVFSATDVIEEYTRPARLVEAGEVVVREALSEVELLDFPGVGTLEAFNTDGLRTLIKTVKARNMREKTMRYPGHADRMRMLRETGLFSETAIDVRGSSVVPRDLTERLLFKAWTRPPGAEELTILRVVVRGRAPGGERRQHTWDLLDRTDPKTGATSMARTTGFPCAIMARMLARREYEDPGIRPPELFAANRSVYQTLIHQLHERGVRFDEKIE